MKLKEFIVESEQQQLDELGAADIGRAVGKAAGGVGAVAGGVKGAWQAAKKGFEKGRATVAGEVPPTGAGTAAPQQQAAQGAAPAATQPTQAATQGGEDPAAIQKQIKQKEIELKTLQGKLKTAQQSAKAAPAQPADQQAAQPAAPQTPPTKLAAPGDVPADSAAKIEPTMDPAQAPAPQQQAPTAAPAGEEPAPQQQAGGKLTPQQLAAKKAELKGKRAAGKTAGTTASGFNKYTKDASSQRIVGANPDGSPKIQQIKASKINLGNNLSETLAQKIELQKRKMFEEGLANGQTSIFVK